MPKITEQWDSVLKEEFNSEQYLSLREFLKTEYNLNLSIHFDEKTLQTCYCLVFVFIVARHFSFRHCR